MQQQIDLTEKMIQDFILQSYKLEVQVKQDSESIINNFVGLSYNTIRKIFSHLLIKNEKNSVNQHEFLLEIRINLSTITCVFKNEICAEAFLFIDKPNN